MLFKSRMRGFLILFLATNFLTAQKVVEKSLINSNASTFQIDVTNCFEMHLETSDTDAIVVTATLDGEYKKDLVLNLKREGDAVFVSAGFQSNFKNPNDKLSTHKVVSIALEIKLPANKRVNVFGLSCNVTANGTYKKVKVTLNDGACNLSKVSGIAEVITQSGNISAESETATITSTSKYGIIDGDLIPNGNDTYTLSTITGNILLNRIE